MSSLLPYLADILPQPQSGGLQAGLDFFSTWITRIGGLIAFIGAIKFALSIKSNDSKEQLQAILVMVSGFMIVSAIQDIDIFYNNGGNAETQFAAMLSFIGKWTRRVGALGLLIGAVMFGLSIKDNNATTKVTSLKTIAAGGMVCSISAMLPLLAYI